MEVLHDQEIDQAGTIDEVQIAKIRVYGLVVRELVVSQYSFFEYSFVTQQWFEENLLKSFFDHEMHPEHFYKMIALLNRDCLSGAFALSFNRQLDQAVQTHNLEQFKSTLGDLRTDFESTSSPTRDHFEKQLQRDKIQSNAQIDRAFSLVMTVDYSKGNPLPSKILKSELPTICESESCDAKLYEGVCRTGVPLWVSEYHSTPGVITTTCYKLPNLLIATILTPDKFPNASRIQKQYVFEFEVVSAFMRIQSE